MKKAPRKIFASEEKYQVFLTHLPASASDPALMALKGHLLVEQALLDFVSLRVPKPGVIKSANVQLGFKALLVFVKCLDDSDSMSWVWVAADKLNKIRNNLAHSLSPSKIDSLVNDFVSYVQHNDGKLLPVASIKDYESFPLAIFQVYERISAYPYYSKDHIKMTRIALAALNGLDVSKHADVPTHGPKPRKKWAPPR